MMMFYLLQGEFYFVFPPLTLKRFDLATNLMHHRLVDI